MWEAGLFWPDFDGDEELVAGETARLVTCSLGNGASRVIYLPMQSNSANTGDEIRFGLLDAEFQPRAGFDTIAGLADFTRQGGVTGRTSPAATAPAPWSGTGPAGAQGLAWAATVTPIPLAGTRGRRIYQPRRPADAAPAHAAIAASTEEPRRRRRRPGRSPTLDAAVVGA